MANTVDKVIAIALNEVGYLEKSAAAYKKDPKVLDKKTEGAGSDNYTKYGRDMHKVYPAVMDFPAYWCDTFVDWCFYMAYGIATAKSLLDGNFDDYTVASATKYKEKGALDDKPSKGAQVFFTKNGRIDGIHHTGLVVSVESSGYFNTVEGNTSGASGVVRNGGGVAKKRYKLSEYKGKVFFGHPKYDVESKTTTNTSKKETTSTTTGESIEDKVWNYLTEKGLNAYAVAGIMGNLYAESGLKPKNLENKYEKEFGLSDNEYTEKVDNGSYKKFTTDKAGYGLAQWTYSTRKEGLLKLAKEKGKSIGNVSIQLSYLWKELSANQDIMDDLKSAKSVKAASNVILLKFEKPADQSAAVQTKRANYGQGYYDKHAKKNSSSSASKTTNSKFPYTVKVDCDVLNVRKGPGTNNAVVKQLKRGDKCTITKESDGKGAKKWGYLKSGSGWISLDYCDKI